MIFRLVMILSMLVGCHADSSTYGHSADLSLVSAEDWVVVDAADDPLADHRPSDLRCSADGVYVEAGILEVDTGRCAYVTLKQETRYALQQGDVVEITIYHDALYSDPPANAHLALLLDRIQLWQTIIPIPSEPRLFSQRFVVPSHLPVGTRIDFHLRNHGLNHWRLVSIERQDESMD